MKWLGLMLAVAGNAWAGGPVPVAHTAETFHFWGDDQNCWEVHAVFPEEQTKNDSEGKDWLANVADEVGNYAKRRRHLNAVTTPRYERELILLREGRWPTVFITRCGEKKVMMSQSFAIRWDDSPLPVEASFFGQVAELPPSIAVNHDAAFMGRFITWLAYPELRLPENKEQLLGFLMLRPWFVGEKAEVKFLISNFPDGGLPFVQALVRTSVINDFHLLSRREITPQLREKIQNWVNGPGKEARDRYRKRFELSLRDVGEFDLRLHESLNAFFTEGLFDPSWQRYIYNSHLYIHCSGRPLDESLETALFRQYLKVLGFPKSAALGFTEDARTGTPGIRTDIFELTTGYYDTVVQASMEEATGFSAEREIVYDQVWTTPGACALSLSDVERALHAHMTRAGFPR